MFRSKKDVDCHVRDVLNKCNSESERLKLCFQISKLYAGIKEFDSAQRYLQSYLNSNPANSAEARKVLADIQIEIGDSTKALENYKLAYSEGKLREALNRVCDLLTKGVGEDTEESKKKWFEMQKSAVNSNLLNSSTSSTPGSPIGPRRSNIYIGGGPPKSGFSQSFTNGSPGGLGSTSKLNGNNGELQLRYLERRIDDGLGKILEQNTLVLEQMLKIREDMKDLGDKVEGIALTQEKLEVTVNELKKTQVETQTLAAENKQNIREALLMASAAKNCKTCENRPAPKEIVQQPCHSASEIASLKDYMDQSEKRTTKLIENLVSTLKFPDPAALFAPYAAYGLPGIPPNPALLPPQLPFTGAATQIVPPLNNPVLPNVMLPPPNSVAPAQPPTMTMKVGPAIMGPPPSSLVPPAAPVPLPTVMVPKPAVAPAAVQPNPPPAVITPVNKDPPQPSVVDWTTPKKVEEKKEGISSFPGLNLSGKFSFGDVAKTNPAAPTFSFSTSGTSAQSFSNAGAPLFSSLASSPVNSKPKEEKNTSHNADEAEDDFVPTAEFQPVIPLPPLVEVKKGDEDENTIAEHRAKIYRFVTETKEWKERGVGNIKLLQSKTDSKKCRVVMWREKVGKLACNFNLFPDIKVTNYQSNPKVLCWKCQDFAEEGAWETFTCRFGNEDDCKHFKTEMERLAKLTVASTDKSPSPSKPAVTTSAVTPTTGAPNNVPLSQLFKKPEGSWNCSGCYCSNTKDSTSCVACQTVRPGYEDKVTPKATEPSSTQSSFSFGFPAANTAAPSFSFGFGNAPAENKVSTPTVTSSTDVVDTKKSELKEENWEEDSSEQANVNGLNLAGKFSFADLAKNNNPTPTFSFGSATSNQTFSGAGSQLFTVASSAVEKNTSHNADEAEDDFVPTAEFQPVIPLPPLVEVKKGDEDENTIAEHRAKIYRFVTETKEWKERGVGNIKLLQSKTDSRKCRVVMWREKVGKLACNFNLFPDIKITNYQSNAKVLCWKCQDFAEEPAWETFTCRFGNENDCANFKTEMERLAKMTVAASDKSPSPSKTDSAPSTAAVTPTTGAPKDVPLSQLFKKPEGSWNCSACYCSNGKDSTACAACQTVRPGYEDQAKAESKDSESSTQPKFSFGLPAANTGAPTFSFGFGSATAASESSSSTTTIVNGDSSKAPAEKKDNAFAGLNLAGKFSFADLAKNNNPTPTFSFASGTTNQTFSGAGTQLFGGLNTSAAANTSGNAEDAEDDFVPTCEFQPVIPLPALVEVKKGDEDENTIAEHRAKIYRFAAETKEWKERGVGNIKLLQSKTDSKKCRVVMWREKVGKLACNFNLFPDIKVTNYQSNPKVLCWKCQDFAEEPAWETFTCRFGNEDDCKHFKTEMERLAKLTDRPSSKLNSPDVPAAPKSSATSTDKPLTQLFTRPEGSWNCSACYCSNLKDVTSCVACGTSQEGSDTTQSDTNCTTSCSGCVGCDPDSYQMKQIKLPPGELIELALDTDSCTDRPETVTFEKFMTAPSRSTDPETSRDSDKNNTSLNNSLSNFSFTYQTPEKTSPISSFQMKAPSFSFKLDESNTSIFGGNSIFTPPVGGNPPGSTPSPFVSPFAQMNSVSPQSGQGAFSIPKPVFNLSADQGDDEEAGQQKEEEEDYEDVEDEEEDECMFEDEAHVFIQDDANAGTDFEDKGEALVRVLYDGETYCARLCITSDGETIAEHLVAAETVLQPKGDLTYEWIGICNYESPVKSRLKVIFSNEESFQSFASVMADSLEFAVQADITEAVLLEDNSAGY